MQLKINNIIADLNNNIALSKIGYSYKNWLSKNVTFSHRVRIARSEDMNALFLSPKNLEIQTDAFSKLYKFEVSEFNQIVFQGTCVFLGVNNKNEYEVQLFDTSYGFFKSLKSKLRSLDLDSSDFVFNFSEYNNLAEINSSVWIWSIANFHESRDLSNNIEGGNLAFSRPFFSVHKLFEKMFDVNGWNLEYDFDKYILSSNAKDFFFTSYEKKRTGLENVKFSFLGYNFLKEDTISGGTELNLRYDCTIRIRGSITASQDTVVKIQGNSSAGNDNQTEYLQVNKGTHYYDFESNQFKTDDTTYNIEILIDNQLNFKDVYVYTKIKEENFGNISDANFIDFLVKTHDNIPNIAQIDLFKQILVLFGGYFHSENLSKKIIIKSMQYLSKMSALNWSQKYIDNSETVYKLDYYGRVNYFDYNNESEDDFKPQNLGRGIFEIDNITLQTEKIIFKSLFGASSEVVINDIQIDMPIYSDTERISTNHIIGYYHQLAGYTTARFLNLNGTNILETYYKNFINALKFSKVIECEFELNKTDFLTFDFSRLVYVEKLKSTFYVIAISNFIKGKKTKVKLLKSL